MLSSYMLIDNLAEIKKNDNILVPCHAIVVASVSLAQT